jgi:colicin import membrane protein
MPVRAQNGAQIGAEAASEQIERERIQRERTQLNQSLEQQRQACYQKLAVTPCINEAKALHNEKMLDLKRQEVSLNDQRRRRSAAQRLADVDARNSPQTQLEKTERRGRAMEASAKKEQSRQERAAKRVPAPTSEPLTLSTEANKESSPAEASAAPARAKPRDPQRAKSTPEQQAAQAARAQKNRQQALEREKAALERQAKARKREAERKKPPAASLPLPS